ncbi:MAG: SdrD B-like domain-containing protein [Chloroflexota bacterium]
MRISYSFIKCLLTFVAALALSMLMTSQDVQAADLAVSHTAITQQSTASCVNILPTYTTNAIGNCVWEDEDGDGIQDSTEPGIANVQVALLQAFVGVVMSTTTDINGHYVFTDVTPGTYIIEFTLPGPNYVYTLEDQGDPYDPTKDSDAKGDDPLKGQTHAFTIDNDDVFLDLDAGMVDFVADKVTPIDIEKSTNGVDADTAPGVFIGEGMTVTWLYTVTNMSDVDLVINDIVDSDNSVILNCPPYDQDDGEHPASLEAGGTFTCTASGFAIAGQYSNTVVVTSTYLNGSPVFTASDPSHYFGTDPGIVLNKTVNGYESDLSENLPHIPIGEIISTTYEIINTGNVTLELETLLSSPVVIARSVTNNDVLSDCLSQAGFPSNELAPGATLTCTLTDTVSAGEGTLVGTHCEVSAIDPAGEEVNDGEESYYIVATTPAIEIEKLTNGYDADSPWELQLLAGLPVTWSYIITNSSALSLTDISIVDDPEGVICTHSPLGPGDSTTCTHVGTVQPGGYSNTAVVTGTYDHFGYQFTATDTDGSHYFGINPQIDLEKATNGADADNWDDPDVPSIPEGDDVVWTYVVTNTGNITLVVTALNDDPIGPIILEYGSLADHIVCVSDLNNEFSQLLAPGASFTCIVTGTAIAEPYTNTATVTATYDIPAPINVDDEPINDTDPSHYNGYGVSDLAIDKMIADTYDDPNGILITYVLSYTNIGSGSAQDVLITDILPAGVSPTGQPAETNPGLGPPMVTTIPNGPSYITWTVGTLGPGAGGRITFTAGIIGEVADGTTYTNTATIQGSNTDIDPSNNRDDAPLTVDGPVQGACTNGAQCFPTSVDLLSFIAYATDQGINVEWVTGAEVDTLGFDLYRSTDTNLDHAVRVTPDLIDDQGEDGGFYIFVDTTALPFINYTYWLVETEEDGTQLEYGPIQANIFSVSGPANDVILGLSETQPFSIFLPMVTN